MASERPFDTLGGEDPGPEDELGGPYPDTADTLGGADPGPEDELGVPKREK